MSLCVYARITPMCITEEILDRMIVSFFISDDNMINDGFEYMQLIIFDILKDTCSIDDYKDIIRFCIYLQDETDCKILITSDAHDEICFLANRKVVWSKEKLFD